MLLFLEKSAERWGKGAWKFWWTSAQWIIIQLAIRRGLWTYSVKPQRAIGRAISRRSCGRIHTWTNTHEQMPFGIIKIICIETLVGYISTTLTTDNEAASHRLAFSEAFHEDFLHFRVTFATTHVWCHPQNKTCLVPCIAYLDCFYFTLGFCHEDHIILW